MNSTVLYQQGQPNISAPCRKTSFLGLTVELRTAIYEHLIPNDEVQGYWFVSKFGGPPDNRPVRHDKQPCCPAILRINQQIHDEVIGMFYGTAHFRIFVTGCWCYFLGLKFCTQDLENATANKLPPGFRFVRSLHISVRMDWPWNPGEQPPLDLARARLPPGTTLIAECLSKGPYEIRQVTLHEVVPFKKQMRAVIDSAIEDRGELFRAVLKQYLAPLRILRGVDLKLVNLEKIGCRKHYRQLVIDYYLRSREDVLPVFSRLERIKIRFLEKLIEQVSQHA